MISRSVLLMYALSFCHFVFTFLFLKLSVKKNFLSNKYIFRKTILYQVKWVLKVPVDILNYINRNFQNQSRSLILDSKYHTEKQAAKNHAAKNVFGHSDIFTESNSNVFATTTHQRIFVKEMRRVGEIKSELLFIHLINFLYHFLFGLLSITVIFRYSFPNHEWI